MSECKYCKSKEKPTYDSDTRYECGSHFYFASHYNQSNACKRITTLEARVSVLEKEVENYKKLSEERCQFINNGVEFDYITLPEFKDDSALAVYSRCQLLDEFAIIDMNNGRATITPPKEKL
jgi:hypothetical protein